MRDLHCRSPRHGLFLLFAASSVALAVSLLPGCDDGALSSPASTAGVQPAGLTAKQAAAVIAKVGDKEITLGHVAATLERMNQFDRRRYQTKERRLELLKEIIDLELLSQEARRRGLHKKPQVQEAIRQILREAMLAKARRDVPPPAEIPAGDVSAYYQKHKDTFREPERRRVSAIVLEDEAAAKKVLSKALVLKDAQAWGKLYFEHSITAPKSRDKTAPLDLAGDLGMVGPPGDPKGANTNVPAQVQRAVFEIKKVGSVFTKRVRAGDRFFIVRLAGLSKGHTRTLAEADRAIRVAIMQENIAKREAAMEAELRKRFVVTVDDEALKKLKLPPALQKYKPYWEQGAASGSGSASVAAPASASAPSADPSAAPSAAPSAHGP